MTSDSDQRRIGHADPLREFAEAQAGTCGPVLTLTQIISPAQRPTRLPHPKDRVTVNHEPTSTNVGVFTDPEAHATSIFLASLATLNTAIARYVLRESDASAEPTSLTDELVLAEHLATAAAGLCDQIKRRKQPRHGGS